MLSHNEELKGETISDGTEVDIEEVVNYNSVVKAFKTKQQVTKLSNCSSEVNQNFPKKFYKGIF
jgi:hypothetical protein